jgi:hypothetical protein
VLDFGLAKAMASEAWGTGRPEASPTLTMRATMAGVILGTAAYMSPEQVSADRDGPDSMPVFNGMLDFHKVGKLPLP